MTPKQAKFVQHYLISNNATQAAIAAGYDPKWATTNTVKLTKQYEVAAAIEAGRAKALKRSELTADKIIEEIRRLAFSDPRRLYDPVTKKLKHVLDLDDEAAAAVYSPDTKIRNLAAGDGVQDTIEAIKTWPKDRALDQLVKIFGLNAPEKHQIEVSTLENRLKLGRERNAGRP